MEETIKMSFVGLKCHLFFFFFFFFFFPLEEEMATHSSILAWEIPWIEEPGMLQSIGSQSQT